jgi:hypothetical protein
MKASNAGLRRRVYAPGFVSPARLSFNAYDSKLAAESED